MKQPRHDLGMAAVVKADALGTPGKRTFRLVVQAERGSAVVWLEKEQLSALALAMKKLLSDLPPEQQQHRFSIPPAGAKEPFFDFKAAALALAFDEERRTVGLMAYEPKDAEAERPTVAWWTTPQRVEALAEEVLQVVAAGRPLCILCKQPMDPEGHWCFRANGHKKGAEEL